MSIEQQLRLFIVDNFTYSSDADQVTDDVPLFDRGIIDSTGVLELVAYLEETFQIAVDDEEMLPENFETITNLAAFVRRKTAKP